MKVNGQVIYDVIAVDCWKSEDLDNRDIDVGPIRLFFLTHLHADHIVGLNASWNRGPIYTSPGNKKIAKKFLHEDVCKKLIPLQVGVTHELKLGGADEPVVRVNFVDANHVFGAVMIVLQGFFGNVIYSGDFRYSPSVIMENQLLSQLIAWEDVDHVYLDNTFFDPKFSFGSQQSVMHRVKDFLDDHKDKHILIACKRLGKEPAFVEIAQHLNERICVDKDQFELFQMMGLPDVFTTEANETRVRLVKQSLLSKKLLEQENECRPTVGLVLSALFYGNVKETGNSPYLHFFEFSDHSSYVEIVQFVQDVKPKKLTPIVKSGGELVSLNPLLSKLPEKNIYWKPTKASYYSIDQHHDQEKPLLPLRMNSMRRLYRGKKGAQYASSEESVKKRKIDDELDATPSKIARIEEEQSLEIEVNSELNNKLDESISVSLMTGKSSSFELTCFVKEQGPEDEKETVIERSSSCSKSQESTESSLKSFSEVKMSEESSKSLIEITPEKNGSNLKKNEKCVQVEAKVSEQKKPLTENPNCLKDVISQETSKSLIEMTPDILLNEKQIQVYSQDKKSCISRSESSSEFRMSRESSKSLIERSNSSSVSQESSLLGKTRSSKESSKSIIEVTPQELAKQNDLGERQQQFDAFNEQQDIVMSDDDEIVENTAHKEKESNEKSKGETDKEETFTLWRRISDAFGTVCRAMIMSKDKKSLPRETVETLKLNLTELEENLDK